MGNWEIAGERAGERGVVGAREGGEAESGGGFRHWRNLQRGNGTCGQWKEQGRGKEASLTPHVVGWPRGATRRFITSKPSLLTSVFRFFFIFIFFCFVFILMFHTDEAAHVTI